MSKKTFEMAGNSRANLYLIALASLSAVPLGAVVAILISELARRIIPAATQENWRLGNLAFSGFSKSGDIIFAIIIILLVATAGVFAHYWISKSLDQKLVQYYILVFSIPAVVVLIASVFSRSLPLYPIEANPFFACALMQFGVISYIAIISLFSRRMHQRSENQISLAYRALLASAIPFSATGLIFVLRVLAPSFEFKLNLSLVLAVEFLLVACFTLIELLVRSRRLSLALQSIFVAALSLASLLPPMLSSERGAITSVAGIKFTPWAIFLILFSIILSAESLIRALKKGGSRNSLSHVPTLVLALYIVLLRSRFASPSVPSDNYHFGELFSPTELFINFGQKPYIDLYLPRGLLQNFLPQWINTLFSDGQATTLAYASPILLLLICSISLSIFRVVLGLIWGFLATLSLAVSNFYLEGDLLALSLLAIITYLIVNYFKWGLPGLVLIFGSVTAILLYPLIGFGVAALGGAIFFASLISLPFDLKYFFQNLLSAAGAFVLVAISPLFPYVTSAFEYLKSNAGSNSEAFGISYQFTWQSQNGIDWIFGILFLAAIPVSAFLVFDLLRRSTANKSGFLLGLALALSPAIFVLLYSSRYLGRIDPVAWSSRPIFGSIAVLAVVIPIFVNYLKPTWHKAGIYLSLCVALILSFASAPALVATNLTSAVGKTPVVDVSTSADFATSIPALGLGQMDEQNAEYLKQVQTVAEILPHGERVLNLTNYGTLFSYFNWRNPIPYLAPYNIESSKSEMAVIDALNKEPPNVALVSPGIWFDGGSLSTRTPDLSNWLTQNFRPLECDGLIWAVNNNAPESLTRLLETKCIFTPAEGAPGMWQTAIGAPENLGKAPQYWGNMLSLQKFDTVSVTEPSEELRWEFSVDAPERLAITFQSQCSVGYSISSLLPESSDIARISFLDDSGTTIASSVFSWGPGTSVIPLSSYPILMSRERLKFSLEISSQHCGVWKVESLLIQKN